MNLTHGDETDRKTSPVIHNAGLKTPPNEQPTAVRRRSQPEKMKKKKARHEKTGA